MYRKDQFLKRILFLVKKISEIKVKLLLLPSAEKEVSNLCLTLLSSE